MIKKDLQNYSPDFELQPGDELVRTNEHGYEYISIVADPPYDEKGRVVVLDGREHMSGNRSATAPAVARYIRQSPKLMGRVVRRSA